jgi:hypothetical protein
MTTDSDPYRYVFIPTEARGQLCSCGEGHNFLPRRSAIDFDEGNGTAQVGLVCPRGNSNSSVYDWTPSDDVFRATFGHGFDDETRQRRRRPRRRRLLPPPLRLRGVASPAVGAARGPAAGCCCDHYPLRQQEEFECRRTGCRPAVTAGRRGRCGSTSSIS